jgi:hypothetical protein
VFRPSHQILLALAALVGLNVWAPEDYAWAVYLATIASALGLIAAFGVAAKSKLAGVFIDDRNRISLSKLQQGLWSIAVLCSVLTIASYRLRYGYPELSAEAYPWLYDDGALRAGVSAADIGALTFHIPEELFYAVGLSLGSMVLTPLILRPKGARLPSDEDIIQAETTTVDRPRNLRAFGLVHARANPSGARWSDVVKGDEVSNAGHYDLSKLQQLGITLLLIGVYVASVVAALRVSDVLNSLPALDLGLVTLMAVSHAGYLSYKAAPHGGSAHEGARLPGPASAARVDGHIETA